MLRDDARLDAGLVSQLNALLPDRWLAERLEINRRTRLVGEAAYSHEARLPPTPRDIGRGWRVTAEWTRGQFGRATSLGTSALLGTVETSLRVVSQRGSKQCHTRRATPVKPGDWTLSVCELAVRHAPRDVECGGERGGGKTEERPVGAGHVARRFRTADSPADRRRCAASPVCSGVRVSSATRAGRRSWLRGTAYSHTAGRPLSLVTGRCRCAS